MASVPLQLPRLLNITTMEEPKFYGDYVLLTFPLRDPYDLEEVMDMFEDDMELITLYHHIPAGSGNFGIAPAPIQPRVRRCSNQRQDGGGRQGAPYHRDCL